MNTNAYLLIPRSTLTLDQAIFRKKGEQGFLYSLFFISSTSLSTNAPLLNFSILWFESPLWGCAGKSLGLLACLLPEPQAQARPVLWIRQA